MRRRVAGMIILFAAVACGETELTSEFTGNESTYSLQQTSVHNVNGAVTIREKNDGTSLLIIELSGTEGGLQLPAHLHLGDLSTPGAEIAALLNPVIGSTGKSETHLQFLANETKITYKDLVELNASIKIHLSDSGPERDIILAGGNIGAAVAASSGRRGIGVCKSE